MSRGLLGATKIIGTVPVQSPPRFFGEKFINNVPKNQAMDKLSAHPTQLNEKKQP